MSSPADDAEATFLGFGAFETTAFCTSIIVAVYSLIDNPKGRQTGTDQSEYLVYAGWRLACLCILAQVVLMAIVIRELVVDDSIDERHIFWVAALMVSPWAPLTGLVWKTLSSASRVARMMRSRLIRNEIAALIRDRFQFGQRGISTPVLLYHAEGKLPEHPLGALLANSRLAPHLKLLRTYAKTASQTVAPALELGSLWVMNQGPQPSLIPRYKYIAWRIVSKVDVLASYLTVRELPLHVEPMPDVKDFGVRARVLDIADMLQQGGTISDSLMARSMESRFCERCQISMRGTVEAFLESSERGHTDLRAKLWLQNVGMNWRGSFERVIDILWEAAFMDCKGMKVEYDEKDESPSFGDRGKTTTTKTMALIWIIIRSAAHEEGEDSSYQAISSIVGDGPFSRPWWDRYWHEFANRLEPSEFGFDSPISEININSQTPAHFKATLRTLIDEDMAKIVNILVQNPLSEGLCKDEKCMLFHGRLHLQRYEP